jgi:hypothetical protein
MSDGVRVLPEPMEFLDLAHGASIQLRIDRYDQGVATIHPTQVTHRHRRIFMEQQGLTEPPAAGMPIGIQVPVIRLYGTRLDKESPTRYWDISAKTLQADLLPRLIAMQGIPLTLTITATGERPTKRYSVEQ